MVTKILVVTKASETVEDLHKLQLEHKESLEFFFSNKSNDALEVISEKNISIIITDLRMPKFNYSDFFTILQTNFPKIFRVSISSINEKDTVVRFSKSIHRSIKLPLNNADFMKTITDLMKLLRTELDAGLIEKINGLGAIPVLPEIYMRLERELNRSTFSMHRVAEIIQADPLMVARILHIAHSSFFNIPSGINNLLQALNFLGVNIVATLVLYVKVFSVRDVSPQAQSMLKAIKTHSINVAKYSKTMMERETKDKNLIELAYITGLLHDVGKVILIQFTDKQKQSAYFQNFNSHNSTEMEEKLFGVSHISIGAYILRLWNFQDEIIEAVASHHDSSVTNNNTLSLKEIVFSSNIYCHEAEKIALNISEPYGSSKFDQWDQLFQDDIRPALNLPI